jgi:hypothetical protein
MHYESGDIDFLEIFREVCLGEGRNAIYDAFETGLHPLEPERIPQTLRNLGILPVGSVERRGEILEELRTIGEDSGTDLC